MRHKRMTAEQYLSADPDQFDLIVNDMRMDARDSARMMVAYARQLYRHGLMLGDEGLLSPSQAQMAVEAAIIECDRFYPVFQFILWGDKTPAEALAAAMVDAAGEA